VKRSTILMSVAIIILLMSNVWFAYASLDCGVSLSYRDVSLHDNATALRQALAILPTVAAAPTDRDAVIAAALRSADHPDTFEKDGYLYIGRLGLKFSADGKLIDATTSWK
jgi:Co/Zn/Cd efflux system component